MVFDLPLFRLEPTTQPIMRLLSVFNVSMAAAAYGGSKTAPYSELQIRGRKCT
jgi:hypothetical protein